jgi:hypothetical protein
MITTMIKWTRKGKCDRKNCKAACCRALNLSTGSFDNDCGVTPDQMLIVYANSTCSNINELNSTFDCKIYKNRPTLCKQFPSSPWDLIYQKIKDKCSYWFEIEIKVVNIEPSPVDSPEISPSPVATIDDRNDLNERK